MKFTVPGAERPREQRDWGGFATFNGVLATVMVPLRQLEALLPQPLLCSRADACDEHPLLLAFGEMSAAGGYVNDWQVPTLLRYREVAVLVPLTEHPTHAGACTFPYRMFADDARPVFLGNACYGLRKERAQIDWRGERYEVTCDGRTRFHAAGATEGAWSKLAAFSEATKDARPHALELPLLGRRENGVFVRFAFDWDFVAAEACAFVGDVVLATPECERPLQLRCEGAQSLAVRGLLWRTTAVHPLQRA